MSAHSPGEIHVLFENAFNAADAEALAALYEPGAILMIGGEAIIGRENIRETFQAMFSPGVQMMLRTRSVIESADGLAVLHGEWVVDRMTGTELESVTQGLSTEVVRKQPDGAWLFVIDNPYTPTFEQSDS